MNIEDEVRRIAGVDQPADAIRSMADLVAVFWNALVQQGLPHEAATELTRPLLIKMLGGSPE